MNINPAKAAVVVGKLVPNPKARLREQFHEVARFKYLALRTEETYWQWVVRYLKFHRRPGTPTPDPSQEGSKPDGWRHPRIWVVWRLERFCRIWRTDNRWTGEKLKAES